MVSCLEYLEYIADTVHAGTKRPTHMRAIRIAAESPEPGVTLGCELKGAKKGEPSSGFIAWGDAGAVHNPSTAVGFGFWNQWEGGLDGFDKGEVVGSGRNGFELHSFPQRSKESTSSCSSVSPYTYVGPPRTSIVTFAGANRSAWTSSNDQSTSSKMALKGVP